MSTLVRAAVHVHSDWSYDGRLTLEEVSRLLADRGYDVVFMCEHDRGFDAQRKRAYDAACLDASAAGALLIPGIEYADGADRVHLPVWGVAEFLGEERETAEILDAVTSAGGVSVIAHPKRRDTWKTLRPEWLDQATGIEVWTRKWDGWAPNPWAVRQVATHGLLPVVSLDLHTAGQTFPLAMELTVPEAPTVANCVRALRDGHCRPLIRGRAITPLAEGRLAPAACAVEQLRRPLFRRARKLRDNLTART